MKTETEKWCNESLQAENEQMNTQQKSFPPNAICAVTTQEQLTWWLSWDNVDLSGDYEWVELQSPLISANVHIQHTVSVKTATTIKIAYYTNVQKIRFIDYM